MKFFNYILQGSDASEENAIQAARGLDWQEVETVEADYPNLQYVGTLNGVGIYYNYGHDGYYFTDEDAEDDYEPEEKMQEPIQNIDVLGDLGSYGLNEDVRNLISEALNEVGPEMAARALHGNIGKMNDMRAKQILKDSVTSMFSKYIGRDVPFYFIAREDGHPSKYDLVEVAIGGHGKEYVDFYFYNKDGSESDAPYANDKREIVIRYDIEKDNFHDAANTDYFQYFVNPFTANFFSKAAGAIRKMYYTAYPWKTEVWDNEDMPWKAKKVPDPNFDMNSKVKKGDFRMFSHDSSNMMNMNENEGGSESLRAPFNKIKDGIESSIDIESIPGEDLSKIKSFLEKSVGKGIGDIGLEDFKDAAEDEAKSLEEFDIKKSYNNVMQAISGLGLAASTIGSISTFISGEGMQIMQDFFMNNPEMYNPADATGLAYMATLLGFMTLGGIFGLGWYKAKLNREREHLGESKVVQVTKDQLQQIIKEGVAELHRDALLEEKIRMINEELKDEEKVNCPSCSGKGMVVISYQGEREWDVCDTCNGKGKMSKKNKKSAEKYLYGYDEDEVNEGFDKRGAVYSVEFRDENIPDGFPKVVITRMHEADRKRLWDLDSGVKLRGFGDMSSEDILSKFGVEGPEVDSKEIIDAMGGNTASIWKR